ncbi:hypothetical protein ONZ45_g16041 [Pleurotus djamor]|nr:hypothetical protein ONZ45_g16041 [Pleurotus djamor]
MAPQGVEYWDMSIHVLSKIWCEMSGKLLASLSYGIPASILGINRRLYIIGRFTMTGMPSSRRMVLTDLAIGLLMSAIFTGLISLPHGALGDLYEDIGCFQRYYNTIPAIVIQALPPVVIGVVSGIYGRALQCVHFLQTSHRAKANVESGNMESGNMNISIDFSDYHRLFYLGLVDVIFTIPIATWSAYSLISFAKVHPWIWADVKRDYHRFWIFTRDQWEAINPLQFKIALWFNVLCAYTFFIFFGLNKEARGRYQRAAIWLLKPFIQEELSLHFLHYNSIGILAIGNVQLHTPVLSAQLSIPTLALASARTHRHRQEFLHAR